MDMEMGTYPGSFRSLGTYGCAAASSISSFFFFWDREREFEQNRSLCLNDLIYVRL